MGRSDKPERSFSRVFFVDAGSGQSSIINIGGYRII
jgi:hypothetical protein